jgi:hypothetical protein
MQLRFATVHGGTAATKFIQDRRSVRRRLVRVDGRSRAYRAVKQKIAHYSAVLGKAAKSPLAKARIVELAELEVLTSEIRAAGLRGEMRSGFDLEQLVRMTNCADVLRRRLGLHAFEPLPDEERLGLPSLQELLVAK